MNALSSGCLTLVVGLAASLVTPPAAARETTGAETLAPKNAAPPPAASTRKLAKKKSTTGVSASSRGRAARPSVLSPLGALPAASPPLLGSVSPRDAAVATVVANEAEDEAPSDDAAAPPQAPKRKGAGNKLLLFTDGLLEDIGDVPVLGAFILPVTEGVTIPTFEGLTSLTLAVKPTKITRGSGVVAIGTFD